MKNITKKKREIDLKSLIIGFLLATVTFLLFGSGANVQDVRIVGAGYSSFKLPVTIVDVETSNELRIRLEEVNSSLRIPVKLVDIDTYDELNVRVKD
jgi:tetrahydromethanopterin S-methyltransferase subunit G